MGCFKSKRRQETNLKTDKTKAITKLQNVLIKIDDQKTKLNNVSSALTKVICD